MMELKTEHLLLLPKTRDEALAEIERMPAERRAHVSPIWLARIQAMTAADGWILGFNIVHPMLKAVVGGCGFKAPPSDAGAVEIAYGINPDHQGKGYATEAAEAMVAYAFRDARVRTVLAHTLSSTSASARVLTKAGFRCVGQIVDPEDGDVWRWERARGEQQSSR
jgi:ribosomal-protein-alanine N-acetyltransferase